MVYRNLNENAGRKRQKPPVHPQPSIQSAEQIENLTSGFRAEDNKGKVCEQIPENNMMVRNFNTDASDTKREDYAGKMPPGWKFCPNDEQIISVYLYKRIHNQTLPCKNVINEVHLYEFDAPALIEEYQSSEQHKSWYFFTDRTRKYLGGKRPARSTPNGFWKATEADTLIKDQGKVIGRRMTLKFLWGHQQEGKHRDSGWMMREYRIEEFQIPCSQKRKGKTPKDPARSECDMKLDEAVLCKVYQVQNKNAGRKRHEASGNSSSDSLLDVVYQTQSLNQLAPVLVSPVQDQRNSSSDSLLDVVYQTQSLNQLEKNSSSDSLLDVVYQTQSLNQLAPVLVSPVQDQRNSSSDSLLDVVNQTQSLNQLAPVLVSPVQDQRNSSSDSLLDMVYQTQSLNQLEKNSSSDSLLDVVYQTRNQLAPVLVSPVQDQRNSSSDSLLDVVYQTQSLNQLEKNSSSDSLLDVVYETQSLNQLAPVQDQSTIQPSGPFFPVPLPAYDPNHNTNGLMFSRPNERGRLLNQVNPNYFSTMNQTRSYPTSFLNVNGMGVQLGLSDMQQFHSNLSSDMMALSQDIHQRQLSLSPEQSENLSSGEVLDVAHQTQSLSQDSTVDLPSSHPSPVPCSATDSVYNNGWRLFNQVNSSYSSTVNQDQSYETNSVVNPNLPTWCTGSTNLNSFYVDPSQSGFLDENGFFPVSDTQQLRTNLY
ncbi:uncharacterized protein LOC109846360 [Asparagus officinalis]|nr:uncharacterized protein LOC109846360 [Asparagus officinalis]